MEVKCSSIDKTDTDYFKLLEQGRIDPSVPVSANEGCKSRSRVELQMIMDIQSIFIS